MSSPLIMASSLRWQRPVARWISAVALAILAHPAAAEEQKPLFPQEQMCPGSPPTDGSSPAVRQPQPAGAAPVLVSPQAVIGWLLGENLVRDNALDADGDGDTVVDEKIAALTRDDFCSSVSRTCTADDETALAKAREQLRTFAQAGGRPGYVIERLDQAGKVLPGLATDVEPRAILDPRARLARIRCVALPEAASAAGADNRGYWHKNGDKEGGFRLVGDIDNLSKSRSSLGAVKAAELSITSDLIEDETAYRVNAVAGYAFEIGGGDEILTSFIPFLLAERVTSGGETQIDTLGAGFQQAVEVDWPWALRSEFAVTPVYTTDSDFESHTGTLKFRWTPALADTAPFPLGFSKVYGPVELRFGLDLLADAGRVFNDGEDNNLEDEGSFLRLGGQGALQMRGAPGNPLRQFELKLADRYLYNVDSDFDGINQFDAVLAYLFPGNENYQLSIAYSNGRDENSLELYEFWQTQFGIRF